MGKEVVETQGITFRLPADTYEAFSTVCAEKGISMSACLRQFIDDFLLAKGVSTTPIKEQLDRIETKIDNMTAIDTAVLKAVLTPNL
jgi:hypothetical protein